MFLLGSFSPTQATIVSTTLLIKKQEKPTALSEEKEGDKHCYYEFQNLDSDQVKADKKHKNLLLTAFELLARAPEKTGILIEAHTGLPSNLEQKTYTMAKKYGYSGMYVDLPAIARDHNFQDGNLSYIPFDLRSRAINSPTQLINNTLDLITMHYGNRYSFATVPTNKLLPLLEQVSPNKTTIQEYLDALDGATARMQESAEYDAIIELTTHVHALFDASLPTQTVDQFLIDLARSDIGVFREHLYRIFLPLNRALGHASLEVCLKENLSKFDRLLIVPGQSHLEAARRFLLDRYDVQIEKGPQEAIAGDPDSVPAISDRAIQHLLKAFASDNPAEIAPPQAQTLCLSCHEQPATKTCTRCKIAKYCSRACQKSDWKTHKKQCNVANASE